MTLVSLPLSNVAAIPSQKTTRLDKRSHAGCLRLLPPFMCLNVSSRRNCSMIFPGTGEDLPVDPWISLWIHGSSFPLIFGEKLFPFFQSSGTLFDHHDFSSTMASGLAKLSSSLPRPLTAPIESH